MKERKGEKKKAFLISDEYSIIFFSSPPSPPTPTKISPSAALSFFLVLPIYSIYVLQTAKLPGERERGNPSLPGRKNHTFFMP